jgi:hypothetical protein
VPRCIEKVAPHPLGDARVEWSCSACGISRDVRSEIGTAASARGWASKKRPLGHWIAKFGAKKVVPSDRRAVFLNLRTRKLNEI